MQSSIHMVIAVMAVIAACASVIADSKNLLVQRYAFKALPVLMMIPVVWSAVDVNVTIRIAFIVALVCSVCGDILLIDRQRFIWGLVTFLFAHILYISGMWLSQLDAPRLWTLLPLTLWGGVLFWQLRSSLQRMEFPVLVYISVILVMIWLAYEFHAQVDDRGSLMMLVGAVLFGISDSILAVDHFRRPFRGSQPLILITYYAAQMLIAWSLVYRGVAF